MQSKLESFVESCLNVGSGFIVALAVWQFIVLPLYGFKASFSDNIAITSIFTAVSVARGFVWRRVFNRRALRKEKQKVENSNATSRNHR